MIDKSYGLAVYAPNGEFCGERTFPDREEAEKKKEQELERGYGATIWTYGECVCGQTLDLTHPLTNECHKCGRGYNMSGQEINPRQTYFEDTGETWSDVFVGGDSEDLF